MFRCGLTLSERGVDLEDGYGGNCEDRKDDEDGDEHLFVTIDGDGVEQTAIP